MRHEVRPRLTAIQLAAFAAPNAMIGVWMLLVVVIVPNFYAENTTIGLAALGAVLFFGRFVDAISDVVVGMLSDRTKSKYGPRVPWMVAGIPCALIASFFLFVPPENASPTYFFLALAGIYLAWTMINVPHAAWGSELTQEYDERSRVFTYVAFASSLGMLFASIFPMLPISEQGGFNREAMRAFAYVSFVLLPALIFANVLITPRSRPTEARRPGFGELFSSVRYNGPFRFFVLVAVLGMTASGMAVVLLPVFIGSHLRIPEKIPLLFSVWALAHLIGILFWYKVAIRIGKHVTWALTWGVTVCFLPVYLFAEPGPDAFPIVMMLSTIRGFLGAADQIVAPAIIADVIDYDEYRTGIHRAGNYYSLYLLVFKLCMAVGGGLAFALLGMFGYAIGQPNGESEIRGLEIAFIWIPFVLFMSASLIVSRYPLTRRKHLSIVRFIKRRHIRSE